jgi:hypothetical protein
VLQGDPPVAHPNPSGQSLIDPQQMSNARALPAKTRGVVVQAMTSRPSTGAM